MYRIAQVVPTIILKLVMWSDRQHLDCFKSVNLQFQSQFVPFPWSQDRAAYARLQSGHHVVNFFYQCGFQYLQIGLKDMAQNTIYG